MLPDLAGSDLIFAQAKLSFGLGKPTFAQMNTNFGLGKPTFHP